MEELLYFAGGFGLLIMGFLKMRSKVAGAKAEASLAKTTARAEKLNQEFEELNAKADALRKEEVKPTEMSAEDFWKDKLQ
jgi:cell division protein FtsB